MNKAFKGFKSNLEIHLLLTKSKNNEFAFQFNRSSNEFELVFDDIDIAIIFLSYFTALPYFKKINSAILTTGVVNKEYKFSLPIHQFELDDVIRTVSLFYSYTIGAHSNGIVETHIFNLNSNTLDYIFEMVKQMFDESNKVLNIEKLCIHEI